MNDGSTGEVAGGDKKTDHKHRRMEGKEADVCCGVALTVDGQPGLAGVGRAKVVGDDTLVPPLAGEVHSVQLQGGGVLRHLRVASRARLDA